MRLAFPSLRFIFHASLTDPVFRSTFREMASNDPSNNSPTTFCPECVATGRTQWVCNAAAYASDPDDPEPIPVELNESFAASSICVAPEPLMEGIEVMPLTLRPNTALILSQNSPFYRDTGYKVTMTYRNTIRLLSVASVEPGELRKNARLTPISEIGGVPCRFPMETMIDVGDRLTLLSIFRSLGNSPLVTSFTYKEGSEFNLRPVVIQTYINGQLTYLSEPQTPGGNPVFNLIVIHFTSLELYSHRVMFLREERTRGRWQIERLQLTALSPFVTVTILEIIPDDGLFCEGPADPWNHVDGVTTTPLRAIYWMPHAVYTRVTLPTNHAFRVQVSTCPFWAYSTSRFHVRFLVHQLVNFDL